ncbi:MAG: hypothetical protein UW06_C0001G0011 [Parcubacteria group bacterium GW2011_GWE1_43_8]|nr:MAG: hypothetical protein UW06_C0001G0011 [Parcubacteria group bacterium GW2011_GWE1_43_8]
MFEGVDTNKELSARLRQDMNPAVRGVVAPPTPPQPLSAEDIFAKPAPPAKITPVENPPPHDDIFVPEVETAPLISQVSDWRKNYLAWVAGIMVLFPSIFWLAALLYTTGAKMLLLKIVTGIPFLIIVILNAALPVLAIIFSLVMLARSEPGDNGRLIAKLSLGAAILCILPLGWWLLAEAF